MGTPGDSRNGLPDLGSLRELPASYEAVDAYCLELRQWLSATPLRALAFKVELLTREALINAVAYGAAAGAPVRPVRCRVRVVRKWLCIDVADGGRGFDWKSVLARPADDEGCSGRGLRIFREYAGKFMYNKSGNRVWVLVLVG